MPRTRDTSETRRRLSEAVFTTLAELGPTGLTLRAVAERAGCTTGLVLHTFRDKQALLLHARDVLHERTRIRSDALEAAASGPVEALSAVLGEPCRPTQRSSPRRGSGSGSSRRPSATPCWPNAMPSTAARSPPDSSGC
nr:hypothetical protein GCM10025699_63750 [Microbacterium flavescens]